VSGGRRTECAGEQSVSSVWVWSEREDVWRHSFICKAVEVQASGSLKPTIEVHILQSIRAKFGNPVLSR
jgi:hypothetical protein